MISVQSESHLLPQLGKDWEWQDLDRVDAPARAQILLVLKDFIQHHPDAVMDHDPDWLSIRCSHCLYAVQWMVRYSDTHHSLYIHPA